MKTILIVLLSFMSTLLVTPAQSQERPSQKAFKGMELYSWKDTNGDWVFALLPGTNRLKAEAEAKKKETQIPGADELGKHFLRLAEGEQVFWFHRDLKGFSYPDEKMIDEIASLAKKAKVELHVPPKDERKG
jgi:hypothetical protein